MSRIVFSPTIFVVLRSRCFFKNGMDVVIWVFHNSVCKNMTHNKTLPWKQAQSFVNGSHKSASHFINHSSPIRISKNIKHLFPTLALWVTKLQTYFATFHNIQLFSDILTQCAHMLSSSCGTHDSIHNFQNVGYAKVVCPTCASLMEFQ